MRRGIDPLRLRVGPFLGGGLSTAEPVSDGAVGSVTIESTVSAASEKKESWFNTILNWVNNLLVEFFAVIMILSAAIYEPHSSVHPQSSNSTVTDWPVPPPDLITQLMPGAAIILVMMALKDQHYFCPDGTPMVTIVLACAGAYTEGVSTGSSWWERVTRQAKATQVIDISMRLLGQFFAFLVMYYCIVSRHQAELADVPYDQILGDDMLYWDELFASLASGLGIAFCIMPLLKQNSVKAVEDKDKEPLPSFAAKSEIDPPSNDRLFSAAIVLALLQVFLERAFRATANPYTYMLHCKILPSDKCDDTKLVWVVVHQLVGIFLAGLYAYNFLPSTRILSKIFQK